MKLINNILNIFRGGQIVDSAHVVDDIIINHIEINTTVKDIDIICGEINKKRDELISHCDFKPTGPSRCKKEEDKYYSHDKELETELKILKDVYKKMVIIELNNFPLNKPCTIKYITNYIKVDESLVWDLLIDSDINNNKPFLYTYFDNKRFNININSVSESKISIRILRTDDYCSKFLYEEKDNIYKIKLSNWRFVKSMDSNIFYVERIS